MSGSLLKRGFDVVVASLLLFVLAVPMAVVGLAIRVSMGAPVLFRQVRTGRNEQPFVIVKFRTMRSGPDEDPAGDARRITALGRLLRRTSLDELPTLWNVLAGDMSMVGPRPLPSTYLDRYEDDERRRHAVRPGVTGLAQVSGRNSLDWKEQFRLDLSYIDTWSFAADVRILLRTVGVVLGGRGASEPGRATRSELRPR